MWITEKKFKAIVTGLRRRIHETYPLARETISHEKRKIKRECWTDKELSKGVTYMQFAVTARMDLRVNENRIFWLSGISRFKEEQREKVVSLFIETMKEKKVDGILLIAADEKKWYGVSPQATELASMLNHPSFYVGIEGKVTCKEESPDYMCLLQVEKGCIDIGIQPFYGRTFTPLYELRTNEDLEHFLEENRQKNTHLKEARCEIEHYLEHDIQLKRTKVPAIFDFLGKPELVHITRTLRTRTNQEMYLSSVMNVHYEHEDIQELIRITKKAYRDHYHQNRLLHVTGIRHENQH